MAHSDARNSGVDTSGSKETQVPTYTWRAWPAQRRQTSYHIYSLDWVDNKCQSETIENGKSGMLTGWEYDKKSVQAAAHAYEHKTASFRSRPRSTVSARKRSLPPHPACW
jgi:hypothetical protein